MPDIIQQLLDLKEWSQNPERYERRLNFRGAGLVQPGPGRQGYQGNQYTGKPNPYAKNKDFIKFAKDNRHLSRQELMDKFGRIFSKKNKIVGKIINDKFSPERS